MEEKKAAVPHTVEIKKRQTGRVTGVKEVDSFSEEEDVYKRQHSGS